MEFIKKEKKNLAAALITKCNAPSNRFKFISELQKHMRVDIYGKCGKKLCPRNISCRESIYKRYKFFFAFENSFCVDYITEKFFITLKYNIVPVVLGLGDYSYYVSLFSSKFLEIFNEIFSLIHCF